MSETVTVILGSSSPAPICRAVQAEGLVGRYCMLAEGHNGPHWALVRTPYESIEPIAWVGNDART